MFLMKVLGCNFNQLLGSNFISYFRVVKINLNKIIERTGGIRLFILLIIFGLLPTLFSSSVLYFFQDKSDWLFSDTWSAFFCFYLLSIVTMSLALTPTTIIAIISGFFFGWQGLIGIMAAYIVACIFGLKFGRFLYQNIIGESIFQNQRLSRYLDRLHEQEFLLIFFGRLSPVLPFAMMNIVFGALQPKQSTYITASVTGAFPRTFLFFYLGMNATEIWSFAKSPTLEEGASLIPVILVVVSTVGLIWVMKRIIDK